MLIMLQAWRSRRKYRKEDEAYANGFGWAMAHHYLRGYTSMEIWMTVVACPSEEDEHPFNKGALKACTIIERKV